MKIFIVVFTFVLCVYAKEKEDVTLGIPYPMEREFETVTKLKDIIVNPQDSLEDMKKAYSKPLSNDFEYLRLLDEAEAKENLKP